MSEDADVIILLFVSGKDRELSERVKQALETYSRKHQFSSFDATKLIELAESYDVISTPTLILEDLRFGRRSVLVGEPTDAELMRFLQEQPDVVLGHAGLDSEQGVSAAS